MCPFIRSIFQITIMRAFKEVHLLSSIFVTVMAILEGRHSQIANHSKEDICESV